MSGAGQGQGDDKNSMAILWIIGAVFVVGAIVWFSFGTQLKFVFIKIRMLEVYLVWLSVKYLPSSFEAIAIMQQEVYDTLQVTRILRPEMLTLDYAEQISTIIGTYFRIPMSILLALFCYLMYGRNVKMRYRKKYNMVSLAQQESSVWPQINPVLNAKIIEKNLDEGPWAMGLSPLDFCKKYKLISIKVEQAKTVLSGDEVYNMILDEKRAERLFAAQLGRMWNGPERMPIHRRAIFAAIIARGCRDSKASKELLQQINRSAHGGKLDNLNFAGADDLWQKYINERAVQDIIKMHAYESTVIMALFLFAREDGVFATSDFLWLKVIDRSFWYVLNSSGRQTPFCENAGVHAHFLTEKALKKRLGVPMVKEAVKGLQLALNEILYVPTAEEKDEFMKQAAEAQQ